MQRNLALQIATGSTEFIPGAGPTMDKAGQPLDTGMTFRGMNLFSAALHDNYRALCLCLPFQKVDRISITHTR